MESVDRIIHAKAIELGKLAVRATTKAESGHPTTALSLAHITTVLMYHLMRWNPAEPHKLGSDRLVLSEGHAVPIIYAACADIGVAFNPGGPTGKNESRKMTIDDLMTLREIDSAIDGHPNPRMGFPFFDAATGSLGQGLSVAAGLAAAAKIDKQDRAIYCIIGDGESREGQIWEAMDFIADQKLTNVVAIFNANELGQSDWVSHMESADTLVEKAKAFGWKVLDVDGHNPTQLIDALKQRSLAHVAQKPLCIVARTIKGWGAPTLGGTGHHGTPVPEKDLEAVLKELDAMAESLHTKDVSKEESAKVLKIPVPLPVPEKKSEKKKPAGIAEVAVSHKQAEALNDKKKMSPRRGFGLALAALGVSNPDVVALDADVQNSTYSEYFAKEQKDRFFECKIAEQNLVSAAAGLAAADKIPFASTFGKFFSRAFDQIEMAIISGANIKLVGTHVGVTLAADGPSQMATADVPFFRGMAHVIDFRGNPAVTLLTPADAISAYALTLAAAEWPSAIYLRALRADVPLVYKLDEQFPFGKFKIHAPKNTSGKKLTIVTFGYHVHALLKAADQFEKAGIALTLVDAYAIPFETAELFKLADGGPILTVEDNYTGGLNAEVAEAAAATGKAIRVESMTIKNLPKSGKKPEDVLAFVHLAVEDVLKKATALVSAK